MDSSETGKGRNDLMLKKEHCCELPMPMLKDWG